MNENWRERCDWCGWPICKEMKDGCVVDDCSYRPVPKLHFEGRLRREVRKAEAELQALRIADAKRTVALAGALDWALEISRKANANGWVNGGTPTVGLPPDVFNNEIVTAARKLLEEQK